MILLFDSKNVPSFVLTKEGIITLKDGFKERAVLTLMWRKWQSRKKTG